MAFEIHTGDGRDLGVTFLNDEESKDLHTCFDRIAEGLRERAAAMRREQGDTWTLPVTKERRTEMALNIGEVLRARADAWFPRFEKERTAPLMEHKFVFEQRRSVWQARDMYFHCIVPILPPDAPWTVEAEKPRKRAIRRPKPLAARYSRRQPNLQKVVVHKGLRKR